MTAELPSRDPALQKLVNVLGPEKAEAIIAETLKRLRLSGLSSPDDRYRFGSDLISRGGVLEAIGRAIKIQAILRGAKELARCRERRRPVKGPS